MLMAVRDGIRRPGALERYIEGISAKVLAERLRKLVDYGLLSKNTFPEVPPRTEYSLTQAGKHLVRIIGQLQTLNLAPEQSGEGDEEVTVPHPRASRRSRPIFQNEK